MIGFSLKYDGKKYTDKTLLKVSEKMDKLNGTIITEQEFDLDGVKIIRIHKRFEKGYLQNTVSPKTTTALALELVVWVARIINKV